jgi:8-hydroxy-5-deazaflavin:NADPH oxidoreductase
MTDSVSIIGGSGALGFGLAARLATAGIPVIIGSRDASRAAEAAERAAALAPGSTVSGVGNDEAGAASEVVVLAVPFRNHSETLTNLKPVMREGQLLMDTTVPLAAAVSGKATRILGVWQGSAAEQAQEMAADGVRVVSALHSVAAAHLADLEHDLEEDTLVCGDKKSDRERIITLLEHVPGLRGVHGGPLENARYAEQLTPLLIGINVRYKTSAGIRFTNL